MDPLSLDAKPDERRLWDALVNGEWPRDAGRRLGIPRKRVWYLCEKWARKQIYDYGVTCDLGWVNRCGKPCGHVQWAARTSAMTGEFVEIDSRAPACCALVHGHPGECMP